MVERTHHRRFSYSILITLVAVAVGILLGVLGTLIVRNTTPVAIDGSGSTEIEAKTAVGSAWRLSKGLKANVNMASSQRLFEKPRVLITAGRSKNLKPLHKLRFRSKGGITKIEWYDGSWTPLGKTTGSYVSLYINDKRTASTLLGGLRGQDEGVPGNLVWIGQLKPGRLLIEIRVDRADAPGFAIPNARAGFPVPDSLIVTQYVGLSSG